MKTKYLILSSAKVIIAVLLILLHNSFAVDCGLQIHTKNFIFVKPTSKNGKGTYDKPYRFIKTALSKAEPGTTIILLPGTYRGHVSIEKSGKCNLPIIIRGISSDEVVLTGKGNRTGPVLTVKGENIVIENLTVEGRHRSTPSVKSYAVNGIVVRNAENVRIRNIAVRNTLKSSIVIKNSKKVSIEDANIDDCFLIRYHFGYKEFEPGGCIQIGVGKKTKKREKPKVLGTSMKIVLEGNTVKSYGPAVWLGKDAVDVKVARNFFMGQKDIGAVVVYGNHVSIAGNVFVELEAPAVYVGKDDEIKSVGIYWNWIDGDVASFEILAPLKGRICENEAKVKRVRQRKLIRYRYRPFEKCQKPTRVKQ